MVVEVVIASGKGGAGKTMVSSSLAVLLNRMGLGLVMVDADVECPNLHLYLGPVEWVSCEGVGRTLVAHVVDPGRCTRCGRCLEACVFDALKLSPGGPVVDELVCEGCGACVYACGRGVLGLVEGPRLGVIRVGRSQWGMLVSGLAEAGRPGSGRLVEVVRERARRLAGEHGASVVLVDAPAGVGCPVISSLTGARLVVVVVEDTLPGVQDALRLLELAEKLRVPAIAVANKVRGQPSARLVGELERRGVELVEAIPFDPTAWRVSRECRPPVLLDPEAPASRALRRLAEKLVNLLGVEPAS